MQCPFCGHDNIPGIDSCESCSEDLTSFDEAQPKDSLEKGLLKDDILKVAKCNTKIFSSTTSIQEVVDQMTQDNLCCLIMDGESLVGIVTVRDILQKAILRDLELSTTPISKIMTSGPDILNQKDKIVHALNKMAIGGYRHVPIKRDDQSFQVISVRDILGYLVQNVPEAANSKK